MISEFVESITDQIRKSSAFTIEVPDSALQELTNTEYSKRSPFFLNVSKNCYADIVKKYKYQPWVGTEEFSGFKISYNQIDSIKLYLNHYFSHEDELIEEIDKHSK